MERVAVDGRDGDDDALLDLEPLGLGALDQVRRVRVLARELAAVALAQCRDRDDDLAEESAVRVRAWGEAPCGVRKRTRLANNQGERERERSRRDDTH